MTRAKAPRDGDGGTVATLLGRLTPASRAKLLRLLEAEVRDSLAFFRELAAERGGDASEAAILARYLVAREAPDVARLHRARVVQLARQVLADQPRLRLVRGSDGA